jgi:hypothetical protein
MKPTKTTNESIAALTHDVLRRERFEREADLKEAVKGRCAALRIAYDSGTIATALDLVARSRRLVVDPPAQARHEHQAPPAPSRQEAAAFLARLDVHVRTME